MIDYKYEQVLSNGGIREMVRQCMLKERFRAAIYINDRDDRIKCAKKIYSMSKCKMRNSQFGSQIMYDNGSTIHIVPAVESMRCRRSCMVLYDKGIVADILNNIIRRTIIGYDRIEPEHSVPVI